MKKLLIETDNGKLTNTTYELIRSTEGNDEKVELMYSSLTDWNKTNEPAYSLVSNGNNFVFEDKYMKRTIVLDFCQLDMILMLAKLLGEEPEFKIFTEEQ